MSIMNRQKDLREAVDRSFGNFGRWVAYLDNGTYPAPLHLVSAEGADHFHYNGRLLLVHVQLLYQLLYGS